jgi:hypothetical protein
MTEAEWLTSIRPGEMLGFLRSRTGKASLRARLGSERLERKLRLFLAACCRRIWLLLPDERSRRAIEVAERYADREVGAADLRAAYEAAAITYNKVRRTPDAKAYCAACPAAEIAWIDYSNGFDICTYGAECATMALAARLASPSTPAEHDQVVRAAEEASQAALLRDIFGNPFRPPRVASAWRTATAVALARGIYAERAFNVLPILADALEEVGCSEQAILDHLRGPGIHVRGCWPVDLLLTKE